MCRAIFPGLTQLRLLQSIAGGCRRTVHSCVLAEAFEWFEDAMRRGVAHGSLGHDALPTRLRVPVGSRHHQRREPPRSWGTPGSVEISGAFDVSEDAAAISARGYLLIVHSTRWTT
jgi:hypothetical protein